jgi:vanillate O-demethylase monooxygenase subunit
MRNHWYVTAWEHEIPADGLFSRIVLGEAILIYRLADGSLTALEDRCCHRLAPLSKGRKEGDCVRCGYHGLKFDSEGKCVEIPGMGAVPSRARVRRYPACVKHKWVFVWMGEPDHADPALLPDNFASDHPDWRNLPGYLHYDTNYLLICDNLLDFSHLSYVHPTTLGGSPAIAQAKPSIESISRGIRISRYVYDVPPPPFYRSLRPITGNVDRWMIYDFLLPGILLLHSGGRPVNSAPGDESCTVDLRACQALTPETESSTHYFFQQAHRIDQGDASITQLLYDVTVAAFHEDLAMISAQENNIALNPDAPMLGLHMDAALARFRRLVADSLKSQREVLSA